MDHLQEATDKISSMSLFYLHFQFEYQINIDKNQLNHYCDIMGRCHVTVIKFTRCLLVMTIQAQKLVEFSVFKFHEVVYQQSTDEVNIFNRLPCKFC